jgi:hypothetical protein
MYGVSYLERGESTDVLALAVEAISVLFEWNNFDKSELGDMVSYCSPRNYRYATIAMWLKGRVP